MLVGFGLITLGYTRDALPEVQIDHDALTVLYGNGLIMKLQEEGSLEAHLHAAAPDKKEQFRAMAYSGDQVGFRIRAEKFGTHMAYLVKQWKADRVVMGFGGNEAYGGADGLAEFKEDLQSYLGIIAQRHKGAELVLVSPIAAEKNSDILNADLERRNNDLSLYTEAMREGATQVKGVTFIDIYTPTLAAFTGQDGKYTFDGMHLNDAGAELVGRLLAEKLNGAEAMSDEVEPAFKRLKELVVRKSAEVLQAYHPSNGVHYYGVRGRTYEYLPEIPHHLKLANTLDEVIWEQAQDLSQVSEIPTLEVLQTEVKSNKPKRGLGEVKSSKEDLKDFKMAEGFSVECFATSEQFPALVNPLQIQSDARGRIWVTTYRDYPNPLPGAKADDKILIYEDTDGDGSADVETVFCEGLYLPDGFVFYKKGVLVSANRKILYLEDTDGDGKADLEEEVLRGFDYTDTHHSGYLARTPRGDLLISEGLFHRGQFEALNGVMHTKDTCIMSLDMDTRHLTLERQTEAPNPWKISYNRHGESIQYYGGGQTLDADVFNIATPVGVVEQGAIGGVLRYDKGCTAEIVESPHFPQEWQGGVLSGHLLTKNEINYTPIKVEKGTYRTAGQKVTLISSKNKVFRPTDMTFGMDGALYISDFYYPIIGHAQHSIRDKNRDFANGRIWRVVHDESPLVKIPTVPGKGAEELIPLLKHPYLKVRQSARIALEALDREAVLNAVSGVEGEEGFLLEVLWLQERFKSFQSPEILRSLLDSSDINMQRAAVRSLRWWADSLGEAETRAILEKMAQHDDERLRIAVVSVISHLCQEQESLAEILEQIKPRDKPLTSVLDLMKRRNKGGISPEFPLLTINKKAYLSADFYLSDDFVKQGELYFKSDEERDLVVGHAGNPNVNLNANDSPLLIATSLHTKSSQNSLSVQKGLNKLEYVMSPSRRKNAKELEPGKVPFSLYISDKKGGVSEGITFSQDVTEHAEWKEEYLKQQGENWKEFAVKTFKTHCANCHQVDSKAIGPGMVGLYGKTQMVTFSDGTRREVKVDEDYLRQALLDPTSAYADGFQPIMAKLPLSEQEVDVLIKWIKQL